jgi:hypothetical protein
VLDCIKKLAKWCTPPNDQHCAGTWPAIKQLLCQSSAYFAILERSRAGQIASAYLGMPAFSTAHSLLSLQWRINSNLMCKFGSLTSNVLTYP